MLHITYIIRPSVYGKYLMSEALAESGDFNFGKGL
jgi:hypothetical protein